MESKLEFDDLTPNDRIKELEKQLKNKNKVIDELNRDLKISINRAEDAIKNSGKRAVLNEIEIEKLKSKKILGNAASGDVFLNEMELEIIDTRDFQRLNNIKQLGTTNLVYRSAVHTRFDHSIGVLKMADIIINKIRNNYHSTELQKNISLREEQIIRLIALLHDIGHMPYGHTLEDEFKLFKSHDQQLIRWDHYLGKNSSIGKVIIRFWDEIFHSEFYEIITCDKISEKFPTKAFMYEIVNDTICADLLDYLKRDILFTNLSLESSYRILNFAYIHTTVEKTENSEKTMKNIAFRIFKSKKNENSSELKEYRKDSLSDLTQLLKNRYYLGERVYFHHTKILYGTILAGAILRIKESVGLATLKESKNDVLYVIQTFGDGELIALLEHFDLAIDLIESQNEVDPILWDKLKDSIHKFGINIPPVTVNEPIIKERYRIDGAKKLIKGFLQREKWVELKSYNWEQLGVTIDINNSDFDRIATVVKMNGIHRSSTKRLEYEERICSFIDKMKTGDFLIYIPSTKMSLKPAEVKVPDTQDISVLKPLIKIDHIPTIEKYKSIAKDHYNLFEVKIFVHKDFLPIDVEKIQNKILILRKEAEAMNDPNYKTDTLTELEKELETANTENSVRTYYKDMLEEYADSIILSGVKAKKAHRQFLDKWLNYRVENQNGEIENHDILKITDFTHKFVEQDQHNMEYKPENIWKRFKDFKNIV